MKLGPSITEITVIKEEHDQISGAKKVTIADSANIDAFGRIRVSEPQTLFDSKNIFDDADIENTAEQQPLFFDNQQTAGSGTGTTYDANKASQTLTVSATTEGTRVRQTKMRFNYQPGKSQQIMLTFNLNGTASGITKREGIFDDDNGIFFEASGSDISFVRRTSVTGTPVDNKALRASWNIDPMDGTGLSGITLNFNKTQILIIDYEWLGVGRVRIGWVVDGNIYYAHQFLNANTLETVYMSTPNLPLRSEISNDGTGAANSLTQICSTVISEGGSQDLGIIRYNSTSGTHIDANDENVIYPLCGVRLKTNFIGTSIKLLNAAVQVHTASAKGEWILYSNPTLSIGLTYTNQTNSAVQFGSNLSLATITGGIKFSGGFVEAGGVQIGAAGSDRAGLNTAILPGSLIDGTTDQLVLAFRPIAGSTNVDVEGSLTWRELL